MSEKLSYEEWKKKFGSVAMSQEECGLIKTLHGIDIAEDIEAVNKAEYDFYINGGYDK